MRSASVTKFFCITTSRDQIFFALTGPGHAMTDYEQTCVDFSLDIPQIFCFWEGKKELHHNFELFICQPDWQ